MATQRPVVLVLGDIHVNAECTGIIPLIGKSISPIFLIVTSNSEELSDHPNQRVRLRRWLSKNVVQLGPLSDQDHVSFVERLLGLEGLLANRVAKKTLGMPLFAIELVDYWLERQLLSQTATGLVLVCEVDIPSSLPELWRVRTREFCETLSPSLIQMLEVAAALGHEVDEDEWQQVCDDPKGVYARQRNHESGGMVFSPGAARERFELVNELLQRRLVIETETGWRFAHPEVHKSVMQAASAEGRWRIAHLSCAQLLRRKKEQGEFGAMERYALHLLHGGESMASLGPMLKAVEQRTYSSGPRMALGLLDQCERSMTKLGLKATDRRWVDVWLCRARLSLMVGDNQGAADWASRAREVSLRQHWHDTAWIGQFYCAQVEIRRGNLSEAKAQLESVRELIPEGRDPEMVARVLFGLASIARYQHKFDEAFELYGESCRYFAFAGRADGEARAAGVTWGHSRFHWAIQTRLKSCTDGRITNMKSWVNATRWQTV